MRGQISVEYLIIIAVSFAILVPAGYFFYNYSQSTNEESIRGQINGIGNAIITNAEQIYGLADGSLVTVTMNYPKNIHDIYILDQRELVIEYDLSSGRSSAVFFSNVNMSGNYSYTTPPRATGCTLPCANSTFASDFPNSGNRQMKFQSKTNYVFVTYTR